MKKLILPILLMFAINICHGQFGKVMPMIVKGKHLEGVKKKLYVVLHKEHGEEINGLIKEAVNKYWNYSKYEIVKEEYIKQNFSKNDEVYQFHMYTFSGYSRSTNVSNILMFGITAAFTEKEYYDNRQSATPIPWPLGSAEQEGRTITATLAELKKEDARAFFALAVQQLNTIWKNGTAEMFVHAKVINKLKAKCGDKKILISRASIHGATKEEIKAVYKYRLEFVSPERFREAIINQEDVLVHISLNDLGYGGQSYIYSPKETISYYYEQIVSFSKDSAELAKKEVAFYASLNKAIAKSRK